MTCFSCCYELESFAIYSFAVVSKYTSYIAPATVYFTRHNQYLTPLALRPPANRDVANFHYNQTPLCGCLLLLPPKLKPGNRMLSSLCTFLAYLHSRFNIEQTISPHSAGPHLKLLDQSLPLNFADFPFPGKCLISPHALSSHSSSRHRATVTIFSTS